MIKINYRCSTTLMDLISIGSILVILAVQKTNKTL